jgi:hypothetical protein
MAEEIILSNMSDDSEIKEYINKELMPRVFHDIPLNVLNVGMYSLINEYMSQGMEQQAFTSSFYYNESFITKALLPQSIYAEAAIFNIGYAFALASTCAFLLELKIEDIRNNATENPNNGLMEFILDKNTKFNLKNGSVYSLDYDILVQYTKNDNPSWNIQYMDMDGSNMCATNKNPYIMYRVTETWLCLYITTSEYERQVHTVVNNMMNGIANPDKVINCIDHICGFDVTYINNKGERIFIPHDHLLPINVTVKDDKPYLHYIMDDPNTIRFKFQMNGRRYFIPDSNSSYEITIYTCHGEAANFTGYDNQEQPKVITATNKYSNNANVLKAGFVISPSMMGADIGTTETVRRLTIEAYNTINVLSSDHDIEEWFKTFYFRNVLYPFFFKRRDDPWGRIWSGFLALKDSDNYIFRTNTVSCLIPYKVLKDNNKDNSYSNNEIIIPPGWIWIYEKHGKGDEERYTVVPYTYKNEIKIDDEHTVEYDIVEKANTLASINEKFIFSNPFGIRIQREPFAIGYFNPWINETFTATHISSDFVENDYTDDISYVYHATPIRTDIKRTYKENYYKITSWISPTIGTWNNKNLVQYLRKNAIAPIFSNNMWNYFVEPVDKYAPSIPLLALRQENGYLPFVPESTYLCVRNRNKMDDNTWTLEDVWIEDYSESVKKTVFIPITGEINRLYGDDETWGDNGWWNGYEVYVSGDTTINISPAVESNLKFAKHATGNYYTLKLGENAPVGMIQKMVVTEAVNSSLQKYEETTLVKIGKSYAPQTIINIYYTDGREFHYTITNMANIYTPYTFTVDENGQCVFELDRAGSDAVILYVDMKPTPASGAVDYYRIPFSKFEENHAAYYVQNSLLPMDQNNMRVLLHTVVNGSETGYVEMQPIERENDGSYKFETVMYPLNQMVDVDNRILIASEEYGGGSWINGKPGSGVSIDATNPELKLSILIRSEHPDRESDIKHGDTYTGFRTVDQYQLDDVSLLQELKEMRSTVIFRDDSDMPSSVSELYDDFFELMTYDSSHGNMWNLRKWAHDMYINGTGTDVDLNTLQSYIEMYTDPDTEQVVSTLFAKYNERYLEVFETSIMYPYLETVEGILEDVLNAESIDDVDYTKIYKTLVVYEDEITDMFAAKYNINPGVEIQLVPMVEYTLMNSERFESFVHSFTQVHKAIEPVIFSRLEGNNYLDCKLIGTYGLPHSYTSDLEPNVYWPDLNVKLEFDCHLKNVNMTTNTVTELKNIIKEYFNRLTTVHTAAETVNLENNIYISNLIRKMEAHDNVGYIRFKGWYTNEKNIVNGNYMDANYQGIIQKHKSIDDFDKGELEVYVPEMYILDDADITLNII